MPEVKDIHDQKDIDELNTLLNEQEAEELADGDDIPDMTYDCD